MAEIIYDPIDFQEQFHNSTKPNVYLSAGYGAGKTYSLCMKAFQLMDKNPGLPGGLLCPTLKMFKRDVLPTFKEICFENEILMKFHKTDYVFHFPDTDSQIFVFHADDDGESIRGPNLAFGLINEVTLCSKGAYDAFISRIRLKKAKLRQIAMSGTPEEFNWAYEYFIEEPRRDTELIFGDMRKNTHVAEDYAERLLESYDDLMVQAYVEGQFVSLTGKRAAHKFSRQKHTVSDVRRIEHAPIWISMDFNVDPMSATLWNPLPKTQKTWLQAFDEIKISGSNTYEMCDAIIDKIGVENKDLVTIYPDPAGRSRDTRQRIPKSDIQILKDKGFDHIKYKIPRKGFVRDCLNALNNLFHKDRILVSKKCKNLIADFEQCKIKDDLFEIDKSNPKRSHWLDGAKNMVGIEHPVIRPTQHRSQAR